MEAINSHVILIFLALHPSRELSPTTFKQVFLESLLKHCQDFQLSGYIGIILQKLSSPPSMALATSAAVLPREPQVPQVPQETVYVTGPFTFAVPNYASVEVDLFATGLECKSSAGKGTTMWIECNTAKQTPTPSEDHGTVIPASATGGGFVSNMGNGGGIPSAGILVLVLLLILPYVVFMGYSIGAA
jgi:hypothetical protein